MFEGLRDLFEKYKDRQRSTRAYVESRRRVLALPLESARIEFYDLLGNRHDIEVVRKPSDLSEWKNILAPHMGMAMSEFEMVRWSPHSIEFGRKFLARAGESIVIGHEFDEINLFCRPHSEKIYLSEEPRVEFGAAEEVPSLFHYLLLASLLIPSIEPRLDSNPSTTTG